jgi:hypothetical protein
VREIDDELDRVYFSPPLRRDYGKVDKELVSVVTPPHMTDIALRHLAVAGAIHVPGRWLGYMKYGRRLTVERFDVVKESGDTGPGGEFGFNNCAEISAAHCHQGVFGFGGSSHSAYVEDMIAEGVGGEEYCFDIFLSHLTTSGFIFKPAVIFNLGVPCSRIFVTDSVFTGATGISLSDESEFNNVIC